MIAGSAWALPLDPYLSRPVTVNGAAGGENSLQTELNTIFGAGVVSAANDQLAVGMFQISNPGSYAVAPQFKFEWTANSSTQTIGIFGWNGTTTVDAAIFAGAHNKGDQALISWVTNDSGFITTLNLNDVNAPVSVSNSFTGIDKNFFGFFFDANGAAAGSRYYTVDSLNPNGERRVLGYMPNLSGAAFAYEDGTDFDYQDAGFFVESVAPVPEPGTIILLGAGLLGLGIFGRRRLQK